jgi:Zn-dependent protease with chaperone function
MTAALESRPTLGGLLASLTLVTLLAACAAPAPKTLDADALAQTRTHFAAQSLQRWFDDQSRLFVVTQRLWAAATQSGQCRDLAPDRGLLLSFDRDLPTRLRDELGHTGLAVDAPRVVHAAPDSPAAKAGLQRGDVLLSISGLPMRDVGRLPQETLRHLSGAEALEIVVWDGRAERQVTLGSRPLCAMHTQLEADADINGYYDGQAIHLNRGLLQALTDDAMLAFVVAHELGHVTAGHARARTARVLIGTAIDLALTKGVIPLFGAAGVLSISQDQEREADLLALRLVRQAGYDTAAVANTWFRLADAMPDKVGQRDWFPSHPLMAERHLRLQQALLEEPPVAKAR